MRKTFLFILSIFVCISMLLPCMLVDQCEDEETAGQATHTEKENGCENCSPFSFCSGIPCVLIPNTSRPEPMLRVYATRIFEDYDPEPMPGYQTPLFQPPRQVMKIA